MDPEHYCNLAWTIDRLSMAHLIDKDGTWVEIRCNLDEDKFSGVPALFLDRDGVIVEEVRYLHKVEEMRLVLGAAQTINKANSLGVPVVVVTNQAGIGRGYYNWNDFYRVQETMLYELKAMDAVIDAVFACPHHANGKGQHLCENHPDRKPNPGMLLKAQKIMSIDLHHSWIAGDRATDIGAGHAARCAGGVHLKSGHGSTDGEEEAALKYRSDSFKTLIGQSIAELPILIPLFHT